MPYDGYFKILKRTSKYFTVFINNKSTVISVDPLKYSFSVTTDKVHLYPQLLLL